jgi:hypothetical protein
MTQEEAVQRLTDVMLPLIENRTRDEGEFEGLFAAAADKLTKEELSAILCFVIADYEIFFDVFEKAAENSILKGLRSRSA